MIYSMMPCCIRALRVCDDSGGNQNAYRQALRPHSSLHNLLRSRLVSRRGKPGEWGGKAPRGMILLIAHDDGTSDGHTGGPAAQYDLVLMAANPF
jgi:hypothetical protein